MTALTTPVAIETWADQIKRGDVRAVSRAISAIENRDVHAEELISQLFPATGHAATIGITGAPGTGKSTIADKLAAHYRRAGQSIGIIAVDPTSPYTGGAILGDRIRMQAHAGDSGTFIRSMATRGFLGGLARTTGDVALVLDAAGKQYVLIETVGVGQDEVDVVRLADCTLVVLVPGYGDDIQNMKAGLMEIADIFVLNKSDRDGADRLEMQLEAMLEMAPAGNDWTPRVVRTVATDGKGIEDLAAQIEAFRGYSGNAERRRHKSLELWKRRLLALAEEKFTERAFSRPDSQAYLETLAAEVAERRKDPYSAVRELLLGAGLQI